MRRYIPAFTAGIETSRGRVDVRPVLVGGCVENVVLEVDAILGKDGDGLDGVEWQVDVRFPGCAA